MTEARGSTGWVQSGVLKIKWAKKGNIAAGEVNDVGPSNVSAGIRAHVRKEHDAIAIVDSVAVHGKLMPFGPPAGVSVGLGAVIGVAKEEVNAVGAGIGSLVTFRSARRLLEVDGDQIPLGTEDSKRLVANEEKFVAGAENGLMKSGSTAMPGGE